MYDDSFTEAPYFFDSFWSGKHDQGINDAAPTSRKRKARQLMHQTPSHHPSNARGDGIMEQPPPPAESGAQNEQVFPYK
jgi:hypothetical protein